MQICMDATPVEQFVRMQLSQYEQHLRGDELQPPLIDR